MPWWGWVTIGVLLLTAELTFVDLEFYLVLLGVSALLVGALEPAGVNLPYWAQWLTFAVVSIASLVFFRQRIYGAMHPPSEHDISEGVDGEVGVAQSAIAPGAVGTIELRGTTWTGRNEGDVGIGERQRCRVLRSEGLTVIVRAEP